MSHPEIELAKTNASNAVIAGVTAIHDHIAEYISDYEFLNDEGNFVPGSDVREMLNDAVQGLLTDDKFLDLILSWQKQVKLLRSLP